MASTYGTPVLFAKENNVWVLSARLVFGANGSVVLDQTQSKGFCAAWQNTPTFTAGTNGSSSLVGSVSTFAGLFPGMNLTVGTSAAFIGTATIGSISAANALLGQFPVTAANNAMSGWIQTDVPALTFVAGSAGGGSGQYIIQLGQQAAQRLDTYPKLLMLQHQWDDSTGSAIGGVLQKQLVPSAPAMVLCRNNTKARTIPATATSGSSDATILVQFGTGPGAAFSAAVPNAGEAVRIVMVMGNSTP